MPDNTGGIAPRLAAFFRLRVFPRRPLPMPLFFAETALAPLFPSAGRAPYPPLGAPPLKASAPQRRLFFFDHAVNRKSSCGPSSSASNTRATRVHHLNLDRIQTF